MLKTSLIIKTQGLADQENIVFWEDYRVTVLSPRLFRMEKSPKKSFRDEATQAVWYRNMPKQDFTVEADREKACIRTQACTLILYKDRGQVCVEMDGKRILADNSDNLFGTYRTLDCCNGNVHFVPWIPDDIPYEIELGKGVCAKSGVAVLDDSASLTLGEDGEVKKQTANGSDEYIFAFGNDYRAAVRALYSIAGNTPLVPRYALGNWWSRYHVYTDREYLRVLNRFEERGVPLSVATVDMDWHYSDNADEELGITANGKTGDEYLGERVVNLGWTGYTWNKNLFPDYKSFLKKIKDKGLKITLNLHPSDGVRFWEAAYERMARAMGVDPASQKSVPFDFSYAPFINAYLDILHRPYEKDGVDFWWIDWQQPNIDWHGERKDSDAEKYDPLWALNHYHYLDNADGHSAPLILSRYAGIGSHRYPLGFSGDTEITWKTLAYLPYFTATATNVGYTWWSHDIGGHNFGEKSNELYVRHLQYGVFSPINRLHCACDETMTKEPWEYGNGAGLIAEEFLRLRHKLIPYLYTASYRTHTEGLALVEPLYYRSENENAYGYEREYFFGSELLVAPVTEAMRSGEDYARVRVWLPEGTWTDIFTGDEYEAGKDGKEALLLRELDSIPVLAKSGGILPLSMDKGNAYKNPESLEVWAYVGNGEYVLYEDGKEQEKEGALRTLFKSEFVETEGAGTQSLTISAVGDPAVIPQKRKITVRFKNIPEGKVCLFADGKETQTEELLTDCAAVRLEFEAGKTYRIEVAFRPESKMEKLRERAKRILTRAQMPNREKFALWQELEKAETEGEYVALVDGAELSLSLQARLKETL